MRSPLDAACIAAVAAIISFLDSRALLSKQEEKRLWSEHAKRTADRIIDCGESYGEATGYIGMLPVSGDLGAFQSELRSIDNDLARQVEIVSDGVAQYFVSGAFPPPHYAWRVAVILRGAKQYELEAGFLEAFARHFCRSPVGRYKELAKRAAKSRQLAARAAAARIQPRAKAQADG